MPIRAKTSSRDRADFIIGQDAAVFYEIIGERPEEGWAREANGNRGIPLYSVVRVEFIGYDAEGLPSFLFNYGDARLEQSLRPHDHRDNYNGGYAFAVFHPGTGLPQQPWAE